MVKGEHGDVPLFLCPFLIYTQIEYILALIVASYIQGHALFIISFKTNLCHEYTFPVQLRC